MGERAHWQRTERTKYTECQHCGKELGRHQVKQRNRYCSRRCFCNARYGEMKSVGGIETHSEKLLRAIELCLAGKTQSEAAEIAGIDQSVVSRRLCKYKLTLLPKHVCEYCGAKFARSSRTSRRYCSAKCSHAAYYAAKRAKREHKKTPFSPEKRAAALALYWGGLDGAVIARHLEVPMNTVHGWIHNFGRLKKRRRDPEIVGLLPVNLRLDSAETPSEWQSILRENADGEDASPVIIVCGVRNGNGSVNNLASYVYDALKRDPCDGVTYAFCSAGRGQISTICRRRGAFCLVKMPKANGGYIWPGSSVGLQIEVRQSEFDFLLSLSRKRGAKPSFA